MNVENGVWLASASGVKTRLRDGRGFQSPMIELGLTPEWFENLNALAFEKDPEIRVVNGKGPPSKEELAAIRTKRAKAMAERTKAAAEKEQKVAVAVKKARARIHVKDADEDDN